MEHYETAMLKPKILTRWWKKIKKVKPEEVVYYDNGQRGAEYTFYCPWYFIPFEIIYTIVFGHNKIEDN